MRIGASLLAAAAALAAALAAAPTAAHPLAPALLALDERAPQEFDVTWRLPRLAPPDVAAEPLLPPGCRPQAPALTTRGDLDVTRRWRVACAAPLAGQTVGVRGLAPSLSAVVRIVLADGRTVERVVTADRPTLVVPAEPSLAGVLWSYARLGIEHIATGPDHLLFVFGLVLLSATLRELLATVSAFTLGHSVTLALATLGLVRVPAAPIELGIAASVLLVAVEVARGAASRSLLHRRPWLAAAGFGLLHGLGFAAALRDAGLPARALPPALLAFNLGIEAGQVCFVVAVTLAILALRRPVARLPAWTRRAPVYAMGTLAAFWCFERAAAWLG